MPRGVSNKIGRVRPPRAHITYDVQVGDAIEVKEIPFVVGVLGNFTGYRGRALPKLRDRQFVDVTPENFHKIIAVVNPQISVTVINRVSGGPESAEIVIDLQFSSLAEFEPEQVAKKVAMLDEVLNVRTKLADLRAVLHGNDKLDSLLLELACDSQRLEKVRIELDLPTKPHSDQGIIRVASTSVLQTANKETELTFLEQILEKGRFTRDPDARRHGHDLISAFVAEILRGEMIVARSVETSIDARIAQMDQVMSWQLDEILHSREFQQLEASWRGLKYLVDQSECSDLLKIKMLNVSKQDLLRDLQGAPEVSQSELFVKVYREVFRRSGGAPYAALIGDYEFSQEPEDMELLEKISNIAAMVHAPFLASAAPELLGLRSFNDVDTMWEVGKLFDSMEYVRWKKFRESDDSRYVGLCVPRILLRLPYGRDTKLVGAFEYEEGSGGIEHRHSLWGNTAYALGARLTDAFAKYGWCAAIRGVEGGGLVEGLPTHAFTTGAGKVVVSGPAEVQITDRREAELAGQGFIPLVYCKGTDYAAFLSVQSTQKPRKYDKEVANANSRLSSQLPYVLAISRFAHYIKIIMRDSGRGVLRSRADCHRLLNRWISQYVCADDNATQSVKAQLPLREASIDVVEVVGSPGKYKAVAFLKPHFQLDELGVSLRMVIDLPQPI